MPVRTSIRRGARSSHSTSPAGRSSQSQSPGGRPQCHSATPAAGGHHTRPTEAGGGRLAPAPGVHGRPVSLRHCHCVTCHWGVCTRHSVERSLSSADRAFFSLSSRFWRWLLVVSSSSTRVIDSRSCGAQGGVSYRLTMSRPEFTLRIEDAKQCIWHRRCTGARPRVS